MERITQKERFYFTIHPLFLLFGIFYAFTGKVFLFLTYTLVAVLHEFAHSVAAARVGRRLRKIVLMPYGALICGDMEGISFKDEIFVALAGQFVNLAVALAFIALWWLFPDIYPYTDTAAYASLGIAAVNVLPAFPLDGGRVLYCAIAKRKGEKTALFVCRAVSLTVGAALSALFVYSCFVRINLSLLFFAGFIVAGAFAGKRCRYDRIRYDVTRTLARGAEIKRVAVLENCPLRKIINFIERGKILELCVYSRAGELLEVLDEAEILVVLESSDLYAPLSSCLRGAFANENFEKTDRNSLADLNLLL